VGDWNFTPHLTYTSLYSLAFRRGWTEVDRIGKRLGREKLKEGRENLTAKKSKESFWQTTAAQWWYSQPRKTIVQSVFPKSDFILSFVFARLTWGDSSTWVESLVSWHRSWVDIAPDIKKRLDLEIQEAVKFRKIGAHCYDIDRWLNAQLHRPFWQPASINIDRVWKEEEEEEEEQREVRGPQQQQ
jgi:hypothetical protein